MDTAVPFSLTVNNVEMCQSLSDEKVREVMWNHLRFVMDDVNQGRCRLVK